MGSLTTFSYREGYPAVMINSLKMSQEDTISILREEWEDLQDFLSRSERQRRQALQELRESQDSCRALENRLQFADQMNEKLSEENIRLVSTLANFDMWKQTCDDGYQRVKAKLTSNLQDRLDDKAFGSSRTPSSQSSYRSVTSRPQTLSSRDYQDVERRTGQTSSPPRTHSFLRSSPDPRHAYPWQSGRGSDEGYPLRSSPFSQPLAHGERVSRISREDSDLIAKNLIREGRVRTSRRRESSSDREPEYPSLSMRDHVRDSLQPDLGLQSSTGLPSKSATGEEQKDRRASAALGLVPQKTPQPAIPRARQNPSSPSASSVSTERAPVKLSSTQMKDESSKMPPLAPTSATAVTLVPTVKQTPPAVSNVGKVPSRVSKTTAPPHQESVNVSADPPRQTWATAAVSAPPPKQDMMAEFEAFASTTADGNDGLDPECMAELKAMSMEDPQARERTAKSSDQMTAPTGKPQHRTYDNIAGAAKSTVPASEQQPVGWKSINTQGTPRRESEISAQQVNPLPQPAGLGSSRTSGGQGASQDHSDSGNKVGQDRTQGFDKKMEKDPQLHSQQEKARILPQD